MRTLSRWTSLTFLSLAVTGCATTSPYDEASDPLEPLNRAIYTFNDKVDDHVLKPVAQGYEKVVPSPVRTGVGNFFGNLGEPVVIVNDVLQGNLHQGASDTARFVFNTTFGLLGVLDVAKHMGHPAHDEDFGQTFGKWGIGEGWYLVLPLLGPSTVRDGIGLIPESAMDPVANHPETRERNSAQVLRAIDKRAQLLTASKVRDTAALDPYSFTRESYRQNRWSRIHNGNPPPPNFDDDFE